MNVASIIRHKGANVIRVQPAESITEVVRILVDNRIGAVLVMEGEAIVGVLSERDVIRCIAERGAAALDCTAADLMSAEVMTVTPAETVNQVMSHMTEQRIRHLPVVDEGRLCGIVSIGDLVKARIEEVEREAESLKSYIRAG